MDGWTEFAKEVTSMCNASKAKDSKQGQSPSFHPARSQSKGYDSSQGRSTKAIVKRCGTWLETNREKVNRLRDDAFLMLAEATILRHSVIRRK